MLWYVEWMKASCEKHRISQDKKDDRKGKQIFASELSSLDSTNKDVRHLYDPGWEDEQALIIL